MDQEEMEPCDQCGEPTEVSELQEDDDGYSLCPECYAEWLDSQE